MWVVVIIGLIMGQTGLNLDDGMVRALMQQEISKEAMQKRMAPDAEPTNHDVTTMNPALVSIGGAGLDALSTYKFLKNGKGREDNALHVDSPAGTAAIGAATGPLVYALLKQISPHMAKLWGSQVGAHQLGLGALNFNLNPKQSSFQKLDQMLSQPQRK